MRLFRPLSLIALLALAVQSGCAADGTGPTAPGPPGSAFADLPRSGSAAMGGSLAQRLCAGCHAIGRDGDSPMKSAPPFRTMGVLYPVSDLQEAFAEGLVTAHPAMPAFEMQPQDIADLVAYLESVSGTGARP